MQFDPFLVIEQRFGFSSLMSEKTQSQAITDSEDDINESLPHRVGAPNISLGALFKLAGPLFVANLAIMGAATIDTIMAGRLGAEHLAAVALGGATAIMILFGVVGTLQGLSPIAGHHFGARKMNMIGFELSQNLWIAFILAAIACLLVLQRDFWVEFGGVSGNVAEMTRTYLEASAWGLPAAVICRSFIAVNAAVNRPKVTMYVSLIMLATKAPLNAVFMYGWLGFPALGGAGAAVALSVNSWLALCAYYAVWKFDKYYDAMRPTQFFLPQIKALWHQLKLGVPIGLSVFFEVSSFTLMAIFIARIGTIDVAAHQIVGNITATLYQIPLSLAIAVSVLVSQCLGAGYKDKAYEITVRTLKTAVTIATVAITLLFVFKGQLLELYTRDTAVQTLAQSLLIFGIIYHVTDACQTVGAFALRGYRVTLAPMLIYGILLWAVGLGGGYWFGFHAESFGGPFGAAGFWGSTAFGLVLAGIALASMAVWVARARMKEDRLTSVG